LEAVLNRAGVLSDADKQNLTFQKAIALMLAQPSMIKRPVLDLGHRRLLGFKPELYAQAFGK
jgi:arsenate reductase